MSYGRIFRNLSVLTMLFLTACSRNSNTVQPEHRDLTQAVYASGKVLPLNRYVVFPKYPGYVEEIFVRSGQSVRKGDPLLAIRNETNELAINSSGNAAELARKNADENGPLLTSMREELKAAKAKHELDSLTFTRNQALLKEDAISRQLFDQSKAQADISRGAYMRSKEAYQAAVERYRTEYRNSALQADAQRANRGDYRLLAAIDGKVYDVAPQVGDLVGVQSAMLELGSADSFEVELSIDETDIGLIRNGQEIIYGIDAYPSEPFRGTVKEIIPKIISNSKSSRVKATIQSTASHPLYSGMSVEGNIIIEKKKNCLVIPREFIHNGNQVNVKGNDQPQTIIKGAEDLQFVEVVSGLTGTETLVK